MKGPETCHCLTLVRGLRSFVVWPTENGKNFVQLFVASVTLNIVTAQE